MVMEKKLMAMFQKVDGNPQYFPYVFKYIEKKRCYDIVPKFFTPELEEKLRNQYPEECAFFSLVCLQEIENRKYVFQKALAKNAEGVESLILKKNPYFCEKMYDCVNCHFFHVVFQTENTDYVLFLLKHGYQSDFKEEVRWASESYLEKLFQKAEIRNLFLEVDDAQEFSDIVSYFRNLPESHKHFLAFFGVQDEFKNGRIRKKLFEENFEGILTENVQNEILMLFRTENSSTIQFVIKKTLQDVNFWQKLKGLEEKYFDFNRSLAISFFQKHPHLIQELLTQNLKKEEVIDKINVIKNNPSLTFSSFQDKAPFYRNNYNGEIVEYISPSNEDYLEENILHYNREVVVIDPDGFLQFSYAQSHEMSIKNFFPELYKGDICEVRYEANRAGYVIITIENAWMICWLPPIFTTATYTKFQELIDAISKKKNIISKIKVAAGIALLEEEEKYNMIHGGEFISFPEFQKEMNYFTVHEPNVARKI